MADSITLPDNTRIATTLVSGSHVQHTRDEYVVGKLDSLIAAVQAQTVATQAVEAAVAEVEAKLSSDPPTGADLDALQTSFNSLSAQFANDPALGSDVATLQATVADILARTTADPATGSDVDAVLAAVQTLTAKIPVGGATDAHIDLVTAAINAAASVLPTGAATETTLASVKSTLEAINAKTVVGAATEAGLTALGVKLDTLAATLANIETALADVATGTDLAAIQALLTTDPPTGAGLAAIEADIEAAVAKIASDPALGADIDALKASVDALVAKTSADQATGADIDAVVAQLTAILADIPPGAATDAAINALGTIITNSAAILPTGAATEASVDGIEALLTSLNTKAVTGAATEAGLTALGVKLDSLATHLANIETALSDVATGADLAAIQALLTTDPPTGADLAAIEADIEAAVLKLSADPATATGVANLKASVDALTAKTSADQATGADMDAIVTQLTAILADIPPGAATDSAIEALGAIVTSSAAILPTGAATEASVDGIEALLTSLNSKAIVGPATESTLVQARDRLPASLAASGGLKVDVQGTPPLPSGAATLAKQDALIAAIALVQSAVEGIPSAPTTVDVGNWPTTQPVSLASAPLPVGAATAAKQDEIVAAIGAIPGAPSTVAVSNLPGTQPVSAVSLPLPAGAATAAKQDALISAIALVESAVEAIPAAPSTVSISNLPADSATETTLAAVSSKIVLPSSLESGRLSVLSAEVGNRLSAGEVSLTSVGTTAELALEPTDRSVGIVMRATSATVNATMLIEQQRPDGGWHTCYVTDATSSGTTGPYTSVVITSVGLPRWVWAPVIPGATAIRVRPLSILGGNVVAVRMSASKESPWPPIVGSNVLSAATVTPRPDATSTVAFGGPAYLFNSHGTSGTWDKPRGNLTAVAVPTNYFSADGETMSADMRTWQLSSARVLVPWYEYEPGEQATVALHGYDPVSIDYYLLGSVVIPSEAKLHCAIEIGRGIGSGALLALNRPLPPVIRITLELADITNGPYTGASVEMHV